jgi:uncharacterized protein YkwD
MSISFDSLRRTVVLAAVAVFTAAACVAPLRNVPQTQQSTVSSGTVPRAVPSGTMDAELATIAADLLVAANRARAAAGLRPLAPDAALNRAAMAYAAELATRGVLDHTSTMPGRETMTRRIEAAGGTWRQAGENLARLGGPAADAGPHIVDLWLVSPAHRTNLLERVYTHAGSGAARGARGDWVAVQLYVLPPPARE